MGIQTWDEASLCLALQEIGHAIQSCKDVVLSRLLVLIGLFIAPAAVGSTPERCRVPFPLAIAIG